MREIWLPIVGFGNCYSVSNYGRVMRTSPRNIRRHPTHSRAKPFKPNFCNPSLNSGGYPQVRIGPNGEQKSVSVHRLVAAAFVANPQGLPEVNHIDGRKANNHATNLEWVTHSQNMKHARAAGLQRTRYGEESPHSKLTEKEVTAIRADRRTARVIAAEYGICRNNVYIIKQRRGWLHLA